MHPIHLSIAIGLTSNLIMFYDRMEIVSHHFDLWRKKISNASLHTLNKSTHMYNSLLDQLYSAPNHKILPDLPQLPSGYIHKKTLLISLEDTILYTSWNSHCGWTSRTRPGVDSFIKYLSQFFEIVVFSKHNQTDAHSHMSLIDPHGQCVSHKIFNFNNNLFRTPSTLNRHTSQLLIIHSQTNHSLPSENVIFVQPFNGQPNISNTELNMLVPLLECIAMHHTDISKMIKRFTSSQYSIGQNYINNVNEKIALEYMFGIAPIIRTIRPILSFNPVKSYDMMTQPVKPNVEPNVEHNVEHSLWYLFRSK